ncbi:hypothetical protein ACH474_11175 [Nocardia rhamnosiphila]|uniref:hypothetical protein n=1 Tax=Nocardia rhamnosiphila TaxID=426716 RepID=UPI0033D8460C
MDEAQRAVGLVRKDLDGHSGTDIGTLAERHGYRMVWTVFLDTEPLASALIVVSTVYEHNASAVVVPSFAHVDAFRDAVTDVAVLITPMRLYPRGFHWPTTALEPGRDGR